MLRLVVYLVGIAVVATGLSWLADRPGLIVFNWEGYEGEISVFHAVVGLAFLIGLAILLWSLARAVWTSPATVGNYFYRRRQKRGLEALSSGIIAIGAGDGPSAMRHAVQARKTLPNEPLTHLLRAQAAQLSGDKATTRRIFEAMLAQPDTEQLGLRGLFLEAQREKELEAARQFAERALRLNPKLGWSADALFDLQCKASDWQGALQTLALAKKNGHIDKSVADRRRAVLLTAQAQKAEDQEPDRGLALALEAHHLSPSLVPAAAIAGRLLASRGNIAKAAKVLQKTWLKTPHPDLAAAYAFARIGDSPMDRLNRVRQLASMQQNSIESAIAIARVAIEAKNFDVARGVLEPLLEDRLTQRVATLMARIEAEEKGDAGRVREWLARAVNAQRDPAWTADGVVSDEWAPVSPVTGQLDAFEWRVPVEALESADSGLLADKLAELVAVGAPLDAIESKPVTAPAVATVAATVAAREPGETAVPVAAAQSTVARETSDKSEEKPSGDGSEALEKAAVVTAPAPAPVSAPTAATTSKVSVTPTAAATATPAAPTPAAPTPAATATPSARAATTTPAPAPAATITPPAPATTATPSEKAAAPIPVASVAEGGNVAASPAALGGGAPKPAPNLTGPDTATPVTVGTDKAAAEKSRASVAVVTPADKGQAKPVTKTVAAEHPAPVSTPVAGSTIALAGAADDERKVAAATKGDKQPKIFVSPRAPDDPGPDATASAEDVEPVIPRYGTNR